MTRPLRPESLTVGLGLVALGTLWILANLGRLDLLSTLRTWWPTILIVWGGLELGATFLTRSAAPSEDAGRERPAEHGNE